MGRPLCADAAQLRENRGRNSTVCLSAADKLSLVRADNSLEENRENVGRGKKDGEKNNLGYKQLN